MLIANAQVELERRLSVQRTDFEEQLREQMRRITAAHSKHLEVSICFRHAFRFFTHQLQLQEVLAAQKEQLEAESAKLVKEAVSKERDEFHALMQTSLQRMQAIEEALDNRHQQVQLILSVSIERKPPLYRMSKIVALRNCGLHARTSSSPSCMDVKVPPRTNFVVLHSRLRFVRATKI